MPQYTILPNLNLFSISWDPVIVGLNQIERSFTQFPEGGALANPSASLYFGSRPLDVFFPYYLFPPFFLTSSQLPDQFCTKRFIHLLWISYAQASFFLGGFDSGPFNQMKFCILYLSFVPKEFSDFHADTIYYSLRGQDHRDGVNRVQRED